MRDATSRNQPSDRLRRRPRPLPAVRQPADVASLLLDPPYASPDGRAHKVAQHISARTPIARDLARDFEASPSRGQRAADVR